MNKIIFNDLRREAKKLDLNIDVESDFYKFVDIEKARGPKFAEMGLHPTELWKIIKYNCKCVEKLLNLDAFAKIHFKKTIQSGDSPIDDYELHPSSNHLQYMKVAEIAKTVGFDLFDKKSFDEFADWMYLKTFAGKILADTRPEALLNLEKFGLLVHQSSFMDRELPIVNLVEKPIEKKVPEFDEKVPVNHIPESEKPISEPAKIYPWTITAEDRKLISLPETVQSVNETLPATIPLPTTDEPDDFEVVEHHGPKIEELD
jgi:hypothetical protein